MTLKEYYKEKLMNLLEVKTPAEVTQAGLGGAAAVRRAERLEAIRKVGEARGFRGPKGAKAAKILQRAGIDPRHGAEAFGTMYKPVDPNNPSAGAVMTLGRRSDPDDGSGFSVPLGTIGPYTGRDVPKHGDLGVKAVHAHRAATLPPEEIKAIDDHNKRLAREFGLEGSSPSGRSLPGNSTPTVNPKLKVSAIIAKSKKQK